VRHRLPGNHPVALPPRGHDDDCSPVVPGAELGGRHEADGVGEQRAERPVPDDDQRKPAPRLDELADALLLREPTDVEDVRRVVRLAEGLGDRDGARDHADLAGAETPCVLGERAGRADDSLRPGHETARERPHVPCERHVRAPQLQDERLAGRQGGKRAREPVRMDDVRVTARPPRGAREGEEEERQQRRLPRRAPQVVDDPVAVGDPEVAEARRRDDAHLEPVSTKRLDRVAHERAGHVVRVAGIGRRQDDELHARRRASPVEKTVGAAIASSASTKK
jgi:hypothetical protein